MNWFVIDEYNVYTISKTESGILRWKNLANTGPLVGIKPSPHLSNVVEKIVKVSLLIGPNCTHAIKPGKVIPGNDDDP